MCFFTPVRFSLLCGLAITFNLTSVQAAPVPLIFDTDIGNDVDDVLALGMIHNLQKRGACELLAVTLTNDTPKAAAFVDAVNTFYGRGSIPIGAVRGGVKHGEGRFLKLADATDEDIARYPHDLKSGADAPDAVKLLREVLSKQADGAVVIVQVGFSTNLVRLLASPGDEISPLSGRDLVKQKVKLLSLMAGAFTKIGNDTHYREYNVTQDIPSNQKLAAEWPTPMVWSGFEIGIAVPYQLQSILHDYEYVPHHPLKEAYYLYEPPPHERPTWDLTAVLYAVLPDRGYFDLSEPGIVKVETDGFTTWQPQADSAHRYLKVDATQIARVRELFTWLCSEPPASVTK
jgi:inosine-uridine nucleoside N-ribohydrolase